MLKLALVMASALSLAPIIDPVPTISPDSQYSPVELKLYFDKLYTSTDPDLEMNDFFPPLLKEKVAKVRKQVKNQHLMFFISDKHHPTAHDLLMLPAVNSKGIKTIQVYMPRWMEMIRFKPENDAEYFTTIRWQFALSLTHQILLFEQEEEYKARNEQLSKDRITRDVNHRLLLEVVLPLSEVVPVTVMMDKALSLFEECGNKFPCPAVDDLLGLKP